MDLLRNLGSAAASSLLQKSGITLPYSLGDRVTEYDGKSIWALYDATKKDDSSQISVFHFDATSPSRRNLIPFARNALRKLRTTRHPDVLKFIDVVEQGDNMWIMTERVRPLRGALFSWDDGGSGRGKAKEKNKAREEWTIWGLHRVAIALSFLNTTCASTHGNLSIDSIFLSPSGEWKLGGFEILSSTKDENPILFTIGNQLPQEHDISSPEMKKSGWNALKDLPSGVADAYALGILLNSVFNLTTTPPATVHPPHTAPAASSRGNIPTNIFPLFKKLLNPSSKPRLTSQAFLEIGMGERAGVDGAPGRFFVDNHLVRVCSQLEGFPLASDGEKTEFLRALKESVSSFPPEFAINRLIPSLTLSLERGGASAATVVPLIFELAKLAEVDADSTLLTGRRAYRLDASQYNSLILLPVIKLFANPDRGTRMALLESLPEYEARLDNKMVNDNIWPHLQTGFSDTVPVIREATVRAVSVVAPKLSARILNNDLLRHMARAQSDNEPSIRTNTCILIAKLAPTLSGNTQKKVLVPAFSKALKDPFVHARVAGLAGLTACVDCFDMEDAATKVLSVIGGGLVDKEKIVRDPAFKCLELYRQKLEAYAASLPETALPTESGPNGAAFAPSGGQNVLVSSATGAAGALAGWAFSSISSRLAASDLSTKMASATLSSNPPSPMPGSFSPVSSSTPRAQTSTPPAPSAKKVSTTSTPSRSTKGKGMALGSKLGTKGKLGNGHADLMAELEKEMKEDEAEVAEAWDDDDNNNPYDTGAKDETTQGDLMDVNADQDDWSAFESAPPKIQSMPVDESQSAWRTETKPKVPKIKSDNPWQDPSEDLAAAFNSTPSYPTLSTEPILQPKALASSTQNGASSSLKSGGSTPSVAMSTIPSTRQSPIATPKVDDWGTVGEADMVAVEDKPKAALSPASSSAGVSPAGGLSGLSKEEKAAEMARRREERKARIAQLKEQKKGGA